MEIEAKIKDVSAKKGVEVSKRFACMWTHVTCKLNKNIRI